ncbi:VOC family protein [Nocardia arizonensis]|uniref:VOC family protein n=1 Tax=Nocardia arizonensis TaxID=1141647 RepID=UPI0006D107BB|nr:VOC family protein [Nocardia arizonensis]
MLRGMATTTYYADDLAAAENWYGDLLGIEPYYRVPGGYIEFRIGDHLDELGIVNRAYAPPSARNAPGAGGIVYWHVDDLDATFARLLAMGATEYQPITAHGDGEGFVTASVIDPFGNILGIMTNPHYLEVVAKTGAV